MFGSPAFAHRENFFGHARLNLATEMQNAADAKIDRHRIPRRANAEAIDMPASETVDHVRRGQDNKTYVFVRIDAGGGHPVAQLVIVVRERERHAEGQRFGIAILAFGNQPRQRARRNEWIGDVTIGGRGKVGVEPR